MGTPQLTERPRQQAGRLTDAERFDLEAKLQWELATLRASGRYQVTVGLTEEDLEQLLLCVRPARRP